MTAYNQLINRSDAEALIPEDVSAEIIQMAPESSTVMRMAKRLPNMSRNQRRLPILDSLLEAFFVGEQGRSPQTFDGIKKTSKLLWDNKFINAEEMAVIIPIPETVLEDPDYDIWGEVKPRVAEAFGRKFDAACWFGEAGVTVPALWPDGIMIGMPVDHMIELGTGADLYDDLLGEGGVIAKVEEDGFFVNGHVGAIPLRAKLRGLRDADKQPIFKKVEGLQGKSNYELDGSVIDFPRNGAMDPLTALLLSGDWEQLVYSIRKDVTFKILTEGVITDNSSPRQIIYNLGQDDMVALRCTFRLGWQLPNPINAINQVEATRYPFAALLPAGGGSL